MSGQRPSRLDDTSSWYIPGRSGEGWGRMSLSPAEFHALSGLFPLLAQFKRGRYECACTNSQDSHLVEMTLCAIRSYDLYLLSIHDGADL